ncbi:hypothetical protein BC829DRAFT_400988 [Chytridium lagenaria]|nr:hypothetical protein BC829DRAFT_400988 [Chytridium lagenaria]
MEQVEEAPWPYSDIPEDFITRSRTTPSIFAQKYPIGEQGAFKQVILRKCPDWRHPSALPDEIKDPIRSTKNAKVTKESTWVRRIAARRAAREAEDVINRAVQLAEAAQRKATERRPAQPSIGRQYHRPVALDRQDFSRDFDVGDEHNDHQGLFEAYDGGDGERTYHERIAVHQHRVAVQKRPDVSRAYCKVDILRDMERLIETRTSPDVRASKTLQQPWHPAQNRQLRPQSTSTRPSAFSNTFSSTARTQTLANSKEDIPTDFRPRSSTIPRSRFPTNTAYKPARPSVESDSDSDAYLTADEG